MSYVAKYGRLRWPSATSSAFVELPLTDPAGAWYVVASSGLALRCSNRLAAEQTARSWNADEGR